MRAGAKLSTATIRNLEQFWASVRLAWRFVSFRRSDLFEVCWRSGLGRLLLSPPALCRRAPI
eukprot:3318880-Lingulodinium_polyedra.AAC.1